MILCQICGTLPEKVSNTCLRCRCKRFSYNNPSRKPRDPGCWSFGWRIKMDMKSILDMPGTGLDILGEIDRAQHEALRMVGGKLRLRRAVVPDDVRESVVADFVAEWLARKVLEA